MTFAKTAVDKGWSAREIERRVREAGGPRPQGKPGRPQKTDTRPAEVRSVEQRLRKQLQTDVTISLKDQNRGSLIIEFYSPDDFDRIIDLLGLTNNPH
jgi:ParB family chromosome partitioning protein